MPRKTVGRKILKCNDSKNWNESVRPVLVGT